MTVRVERVLKQCRVKGRMQRWWSEWNKHIPFPLPYPGEKQYELVDPDGLHWMQLVAGVTPMAFISCLSRSHVVTPSPWFANCWSEHAVPLCRGAHSHHARHRNINLNSAVSTHRTAVYESPCYMTRLQGSSAPHSVKPIICSTRAEAEITQF